MDFQESAYLAKTNILLHDIGSSEQGITKAEAKNRLSEYGRNIIESAEKVSAFKVFLSQIKSPLVYILLIAGIITLIMGEFMDAIVIWVTIMVDVILGFIQEYKAESALESLFEKVSILTTVIRDGRLQEIDSKELVIGDILVLKLGDKVPADARILQSTNLEINESVLTGESMPVHKNNKIIKSRVLLADRKNMLYMGTNVVAGNCRAVVIATGMNTQLGTISKDIRESDVEKTFLQKELDQLARTLGGILISITFIIFIIGLIRGSEPGQLFAEAVALAIAGLPESLPVVVTVIFAVGMQKILKNKGLVRKLLATETLGRTEVLCIDKTGTLTEGKMSVTLLNLIGNTYSVEGNTYQHLSKTAQKVVHISTVCNQSFMEEKAEGQIVFRGNPTDAALLKLGYGFGFSKSKFEKQNPMLDFMPFDYSLKLSAALVRDKDHGQFFVCGAPEEVLENCSYYSSDKSNSIDKKELDISAVKKILKENERYAEKGYRILAVAYKDVSHNIKKIDRNFYGLVFLGLVIISDPLRPTAKESVSKIEKAGLKPVLVTGDHANTAVNIAKQVGIKCEDCNVITGDLLHELSDDELDGMVETVTVFARVSPADKVRIVNSWQRKGKIVAMTGDGVNDGPALNLADIGIAVGSGTDVAKEASDLVLLDDNLSTIINAIKHGRGILDNIRKVLTYLLSDTFAEIGIVGVAVLFGYPLPILPAQILWVNLVEDGLPDVALALEPSEKDTLEVPPSTYKRKLLDSEVKTIVFIISWLDDIALLGAYFYYYLNGYDISFIRTMVFTILTIDSLLFAFACKSLRKPIWRIDLFNNKILNLSLVIGVVVLFAAVYFPPLQSLLRTVPLGWNDWLLVGGIGVIDLITIETVKEIFIHKKYWKK